MRAAYKTLNGIATTSSNDTLLVVGLVACISLPLVALFDEVKFGNIHGIFAVVFFGSALIYENWLTTEL